MADSFELDLLPIETSKTINITPACKQYKAWKGAEIVAVGGQDYVKLVKGDKQMQEWLVNLRTYNTQCSNIVQVLQDLQRDASKTELGQDVEPDVVQKSKYRNKLDSKALKALSEGQSISTVKVTLPGFEWKGVSVGPVSTTMPLNLDPSFGCVRPTPQALHWVFMKCQALGKPPKRGRAAGGDCRDSSKRHCSADEGSAPASGSGGPAASAVQG